MNCSYLKRKINNKLYCKYRKKEINIKECSDCEYKLVKKVNGTEQYRALQSSAEQLQRKHTDKSDKLERKRFSIIYNDLTRCAECKSTFAVQKNEVYEGAKRTTSMINGFVVPLCPKHHDMFHSNRAFALKYKRMFQKKYEEEHSHDQFMNLIHRNYL